MKKAVFTLLCFLLASSSFAQLYPRIYLGFLDETGFYRQLLLSFVPDTTFGIDPGFDGAMADVQVTDAFWLLSNTEYVIQAIPEPVSETFLPLGLDIQTDRTITFLIEDTENFTESFEMLIHDSVTDTMHDIKTVGFSIALTAGAHDNRFSFVVFPSSVLSTSDLSLKSETEILFDVQNSELVIEGPEILSNSKLSVFDISGKRVASFPLNSSNKNRIPFSGSSGTFVAILTLEGRIVYVKKIHIPN